MKRAGGTISHASTPSTFTNNGRNSFRISSSLRKWIIFVATRTPTSLVVISPKVIQPSGGIERNGTVTKCSEAIAPTAAKMVNGNVRKSIANAEITASRRAASERATSIRPISVDLRNGRGDVPIRSGNCFQSARRCVGLRIVVTASRGLSRADSSASATRVARRSERNAGRVGQYSRWAAASRACTSATRSPTVWTCSASESWIEMPKWSSTSITISTLSIPMIEANSDRNNGGEERT